jgi:hypothetical protein
VKKLKKIEDLLTSWWLWMIMDALLMDICMFLFHLLNLLHLVVAFSCKTLNSYLVTYMC